MNIFRELRRSKGLTQVQLAKMLFLDQTTVSKWELGRTIPDQATLVKLANFYNVSIDYLLGRTEQPLSVPTEFKDVLVAASGDEQWTQEDIDDIVKFIKYKQATKKEDK